MEFHLYQPLGQLEANSQPTEGSKGPEMPSDVQRCPDPEEIDPQKSKHSGIAKYPVQCAVSAQVFPATWSCSLGRSGHESCESWQQFQAQRQTTNRVFCLLSWYIWYLFDFNMYFHHVSSCFIMFHHVSSCFIFFVVWWSGVKSIEELRREGISVAVEEFGAEGIAELEEKSWGVLPDPWIPRNVRMQKNLTFLEYSWDW